MTTPGISSDGGSITQAMRVGAMRCPACGQVLESPDLAQCPLCKWKLSALQSLNEDCSPYALGLAAGTPNWWSMTRWVWSAGSQRTKHIALMRSSKASRRYIVIALILASISLGAWSAASNGFRETTATPALEPSGSIQPRGFYWVRLIQAPPDDRPISAERKTALWWNPVQSTIAAACGIAMVWIGGVLLLGVANIALGRARPAPGLSEPRMTAAVHYSFAWVLPLCFGAWLETLHPFFRAMGIGSASASNWMDSPMWVGAIIAVAGAVLWWLWMLRLGAAAAPRIRARFIAIYAVLLPGLASALSVGAAWGLDQGLDALFDRARLAF